MARKDSFARYSLGTVTVYCSWTHADEVRHACTNHYKFSALMSLRSRDNVHAGLLCMSWTMCRATQRVKKATESHAGGCFPLLWPPFKFNLILWEFLAWKEKISSMVRQENILEIDTCHTDWSMNYQTQSWFHRNHYIIIIFMRKRFTVTLKQASRREPYVNPSQRHSNAHFLHRPI